MQKKHQKVAMDHKDKGEAYTQTIHNYIVNPIQVKQRGVNHVMAAEIAPLWMIAETLALI